LKDQEKLQKDLEPRDLMVTQFRQNPKLPFDNRSPKDWRMAFQNQLKAILLITASCLGILGSGCTEGDKFFVSPRTALPGNFSATDVRNNNLAADALAFSENAASIDEVRVEMASHSSDLLGPQSSAKDSFVVLLRSGPRLFAAHSDTIQLTETVELTAPDQDRNKTVALNSAIIVPLRLNDYRNQAGLASPNVNDNNEAWLLVYAYDTFTNQNSPIGIGPRRALAAHVFLPAKRLDPVSTDSRLGDLVFGWQTQGRIIRLPFNQTGEDVVGFAAMSDGLVGNAEFRSQASAHSPTTTIPIKGAPGPNSYRFGQDMTRLGLLVTQFKNDDPATPENDSRLVTHYSSFDFAQLNFELAQEFPVPPGHFPGSNVGVFQGATAYDPGIVRISNQHAFLVLKDATRSPNTSNIIVTDQVLTVLTSIDQRDGTSALKGNLDTDLSLNGADRGLHGQGIGEQAQFLTGASILGPDEGLLNQTVLFFRASDNNTLLGDLDTDFQLHAAAVDSTPGAVLEGTLLNLPQRLSQHRDVMGTPFLDPVLDPKLALSRDGLYALVSYRQNEDSSARQGVALNALVFKTNSLSGFPGSRFSTERRIDNGPQDPNRINSMVADVRDFQIQNLITPACGQQTDTALISLIYEQSFNNQDRVFIRPLRVDLSNQSTLTLAAEVELETNNLTPSSFDPITNRSAFSFIENTVDLTQFRLVDIGVGPNGQSHELLAVFSKEADDLDDNDGRGDIDIVAQQITVNLNPNQPTATPGFRARLDDTDEGMGLGVTNRSQLYAVVIPKLSASTTATNSQPNTVSIIFKQPSAGNISGPLGLFVRVLDLKRFRASDSQLFEPPLTDPPQRLDARQSDVQPLTLAGSDRLNPLAIRQQGRPAVLVDGPRMLTFFLQDGHLFASETLDGFTFSNRGGLPDPQIVDNEGFGSNIQSPADLFIAPFDNGQCSSANGAVLVYLKEDKTGSDKRALIRIVVRPF
jgi:hypothetical protein